MTSAPERTAGKGLAAGTLGLWGSTVIGLASTAPVYSLVATLGFVVLAVGEVAGLDQLAELLVGPAGAGVAQPLGGGAEVVGLPQ